MRNETKNDSFALIRRPTLQTGDPTEPARSPRPCRFLLSTSLTLSMCWSGLAENWPQWRGPNLNGTAQATALPVEWSESKNVQWKTAMPSWSGATPIIWNDKVFVMSPSEEASQPTPAATTDQGGNQPSPKRGPRRGGRGGGRGGGMSPGGQQLLLVCVNRADGGILWTRQVDQGNRTYRKQNNSSPSPVTDGELVWTFTGNGVLTAFDMSGTEKWKREIQKDYGQFGLNWGYGSSPLLYEDRLIIPVLHGNNTDDPSYLLALDKKTGKTLWRTERPTDALRESPDSYVTPQVLKLPDHVEVILNGGDIVTGHNIETGREVWRANVLNPGKAGNYRIIPSSLIVGDLIIAPSRVNPMVALKTGGRGDISNTHVVWQSANGPDVPTPVSDGKYLWMVTGDRSIFSCLDLATGKPLYDRERLPTGTYSSSPTLADGKIYLTNESGVTVVIAAEPEFKILAENALDGSMTLSTPAVAGSQIFIRTGKFLYCLAQAGSPPSHR